MTDMLLAAGFITLFFYGYRVMTRLDRFVCRTNHRQAAHIGPGDPFQNAFYRHLLSGPDTHQHAGPDIENEQH